jgi:hypothetical protein
MKKKDIVIYWNKPFHFTFVLHEKPAHHAANFSWRKFKVINQIHQVVHKLAFFYLALLHAFHVVELLYELAEQIEGS